MNPGFDRPDRALLESDIWNALSQIPGTDCRNTLELIYHWARRCHGILLLNSPSVRRAAAAVLGALASDSRIGPVRVYIADLKLKRLASLYSELSKIDLACDVTLYHGSLTQFFRDLPINADLICTDSRCLGRLGEVRSSLSPGGVILGLSETPAPGEAAQDLIDEGVLEREASMSYGGAIYRTTRGCDGPRFVPRAGLRVELQGKLHARYFLSEAETDADHTPVFDLVQDIRREFNRSFPGKSGSGPWPYAAPGPGTLPFTLPSGKPWPKISIVTPTLNQGRYIEQTILSVLHQDYPNAEYIVVDGASTDETPAILEHYRDRLALIISEPDNGQSHAINKGMSKATGEILTWLNGDDMLAPGALASVAFAFDATNADMIAGVCRFYRDGALVSQHLTSCADGPLPLDDLLDLNQGWNAGQFFIQPEVMFTRDVWLRAGGRVNEALHYTMDYELWLRFAHLGARMHVIGRPVAWFRLHEEQKISARSKVALELTQCRDAFLGASGLKHKSASEGIARRQKLRIAMLLEGDSKVPSIKQIQLARTLAMAGHEISMVPDQDAPWRKHFWEVLLDRLSASGPDLVLVCDRSLRAASRFSRRLAKCFRPVVITGDTLAYGPLVETIRWRIPSDFCRPRNQQTCRAELGLPQNRFLIFLAPARDPDMNESLLLIEALARLELLNAAVVVTDAPTTHGRMEVIALGPINDPRRTALVKSAVHVVVATSSASDLEQTVIDAMACGTSAVNGHVAAGQLANWESLMGIPTPEVDPGSLAARIHALYVHPDLRDQLEQWGRIYVDNECSEFSAYRSIFLALERLRLTESLKLRRKIEFVPGTPPIPPSPSKATGDRGVRSTS